LDRVAVTPMVWFLLLIFEYSCGKGGGGQARTGQSGNCPPDGRSRQPIIPIFYST